MSAGDRRRRWWRRWQRRLRDGLDRLRFGGSEDVDHGRHHTDVDRWQPASDRGRGAAPASPRDHQLLRRVAGVRRHAGGHRGDDVQREQDDQRQMDVRAIHVRRVEQ